MFFILDGFGLLHEARIFRVFGKFGDTPCSEKQLHQNAIEQDVCIPHETLQLRLFKVGICNQQKRMNDSH